MHIPYPVLNRVSVGIHCRVTMMALGQSRALHKDRPVQLVML